MTEPADVIQTRAAYDLVAEDYADLLRDQLAEEPYDRAMLGVFAEQIARAGGGLVGDLGCGPGRVAGHLAGLGMDVSGVDLSPRMVEVARRDHPAIPFVVGSMAALPFGDDGTSPAPSPGTRSSTRRTSGRAGVFAEFARVVRPGGILLLAFQVGDDVVHITHAYGHELDAHARRQNPVRIRTLLAEAGFTPSAELVRAPVAPEKVPQGYVMARRDS